MKKILTDRLNHLKSQLKQLTSAKMDKRVDEELAIGLLHRIQELEWVLAKLEKDKTVRKQTFFAISEASVTSIANMNLNI